MDLIRHLDIFDPSKVKGKTAIIGVGATGSATALELAKLGVQELVLYDDDYIEPHNIANQQIYGPSDIGKGKAPTAADVIDELTGYLPTAILSKVGSMADYRKIYPKRAFICVDSINARKDIFNKALFMNGETELIVDMRINSRTVHIIIFDPMNIEHVRLYKNTLWDDEDVDADLGNCGQPISIGDVAHIASSFSSVLFRQWVNGRRDVNEVILQTQDWSIIRNSFK